MKIGVIGSRTFNDYPTLKKVLDNHLKDIINPIIISGGASGADSLAKNYADEKGYESIIFKPDWKSRNGGLLRNTIIIDNSDMLIAFWDLQSKGTGDSIKKAKKKGIPVIIFNTVTYLSSSQSKFEC